MEPLHRYMALIATGDDPAGFPRRHRQLARHCAGWEVALDTPLAAAWVLRRPASRLGHRPLGPDGCVIGRDFEPEAHDLDTLLHRSWGAYVAIAVDRDRREASVQRDPTGRIEAWRLALPGADLIFSHDQDAYRFHRTASPVDWDYLTHHLSQDYLHGAHTCLAGIRELLPGERLRYIAGAATATMPWRPDRVAEATWSDAAEAEQALRDGAQAAVAGWAGSYGRVTLDLSGGLDSTIVLGLLRTCAPRTEIAAAMNWLSPGLAGDERAFAQLAAARYGVRLVEQPTLSRDLDFSTRFPRQLMRPRTRLLPMGHDEAGAELARRFEAEAFFTGTGGDHLFYDHLPVTAAADYLHYGGPWRDFVGTAVAMAQLSQDTVWNVLAELLRRSLGRRPAAHELVSTTNPYLSAAAAEAVDFERYTHPWAVAAADAAPPARLKQILNLVELQRHYYRYGRADVSEEMHVLFSQPVIEAALRTRPDWFAADGRQRGLARRAFADLLPDAIRERRSKGASTGYVTQFLTQRLAPIRGLLLDGRLAARGLLDRPALEDMLTPLGLARGRDHHALIRCLTAELWVRQAESDAASALAEADPEAA